MKGIPKDYEIQHVKPGYYYEIDINQMNNLREYHKINKNEFKIYMKQLDLSVIVHQLKERFDQMHYEAIFSLKHQLLIK